MFFIIKKYKNKVIYNIHSSKKENLRRMEKIKYKCDICEKSYSTRSNLNKHKNKCVDKVKFICEYCNIEFTQKENLKRHLLICKKYEYITIYNEERQKYEEEIKELKQKNELLIQNNINLLKEKEELKKERDEYLNIILNNKKIINNTTNNNNTNNISIINITIEDLNINGLRVHDLMEYGNSIANYVLRQTDIQNKIKLKDKARKLIEYSIEDKKYNDKGRKLIIFIVKNYEDKIMKLLRDTYGNNLDLDNIPIFNSEHLKRLKNIRDNELREIIIEERTDNQLGREIFDTLLDNLSKDSEIKYIVKE